MVGGRDASHQEFRVFICYRRDDVAGYAGRLYDNLVRRFGRDRVFMDVDAIRPGSDFPEVIEQALSQTDVFLALIGEGWLTSVDALGGRRLDNPGDFVRLEIEAALALDIPIIPLLFQSAEMPPPEELPKSLAALARRQALELSDRRWDDDVDDLIAELGRFGLGKQAGPGQPITKAAEPQTGSDQPRPEAAHPAGRRRLLWALTAGVVALVLLAVTTTLLLPDTHRSFNGPTGLAIAPNDALYVADTNSGRVRQVLSNGTIKPFAGGGGSADAYGDGGPATKAELNGPRGLAYSDGSLYVADYYHSTVRMIDSSGTITTIAGNGKNDFSGDDGNAISAGLFVPAGIALAPGGALYIADTKNNRIRRVAGGIITTVAGNGKPGFEGDNGPATRAALSEPQAVAVSADGTLYIADTGNNRVRRVDSGGTITTVAGNGEARFSGEGMAAKDSSLNGPTGIAVAAEGTLYVADTGNNRIRKIAGGIISTVAGNGEARYGGDGGQARAASLAAPTGLALGSDGTLYVADTDNDRIRKVAPDGVISTLA